MTKPFDPIADTERELRDHESGLKTLLIRREYDATPDDIWEALTDPNRIVRWFLPLSGELRVGGRYSLEGNASGEILSCDRPRQVVVTWESSGGTGQVTLRLSPVSERTVLELEHSPVPVEIIPNVSMEMWGLGAGWEMGFTALASYLAGEMPEGRAVDAIANTPPDKLMELGMLAAGISEAWEKVIAADN